MHRGYIKLWRKVFESNVWKNKTLWRFWTWCLLKASHKGYKTMVGFQEIELQPGQFVFGRKKCAEETGLSEQNIRTCIRTLSTTELTIKATNKFSVGTIMNWESYQSEKPAINQQSTNNQPTSNQQVTTNKNDKNVNNEKNKEKNTCPHQKIIEIYHQKLPMLSIVQNHSKELKTRLKVRWQEDPDRQNLEWWEWYFEGVSRCDFLVGKVKDWAASFHWLIGPKNMTKVLNGEYVNRSKGTKTDQAIKEFLNEE